MAGNQPSFMTLQVLTAQWSAIGWGGGLLGAKTWIGVTTSPHLSVSVSAPPPSLSLHNYPSLPSPPPHLLHSSPGILYSPPTVLSFRSLSDNS